MRVPIGENLQAGPNIAASRTVVRFRERESAPPQPVSGSTADDGGSYAISAAASTGLMSNGDSILSIAGRSTEST
jgi:hypothetical protein